MSDCCSRNPQSGAVVTPTTETKNLCPECRQPGQSVGLRTLKHQVKPEHLKTVENGSFSFCRTPTCDVVYFNERGLVLRKTDVRQRVGLKETGDPIPLCYCFGFTEAMVVEEIRLTGNCGIQRRIAEEVKNGNCACEIRNPQGSCCLGSVKAAVKKAVESTGLNSKGSLSSRNPPGDPC